MKIPRASLSIAVLKDEDYVELTSTKGGMEAFGLFVAILVAGRDRLQDGRATRIEGTDALRFENRTSHVLKLVNSNPAQLKKCLDVFKAVGNETGTKPWIYVDNTDRLVIRSFFKFNTKEGWGGPRNGSGRPPTGNQLDSDSEPSCDPSGAGTYPGAGAGSGSDTGTAGRVESSGKGSLPFPTEDDLLHIHPGPFEHPRDEAEQLYTDIWKAFRSEDICKGWYEAQRRFSIAAWRSAFSQARRQNRPFGSIGYVEKIAHQFNPDGSPRGSKPGAPQSPDDPFSADPDAQIKADREAARRLFGPKETADA